ncbi:Serine carboxypeptidase-like 2 [Glycine max]|nr:Serine carboxypeptidase-like 2 [Glycine max]
MGKFSSSYSTFDYGVLLVFLLLSHFSFQLGLCGSIGPLPFVLETGYVGVGESEDVQAFYYSIESENNPKEDPLMLWLTVALVAHGPLAFNHEEYNGSLPTLILRPQSWTKVSSIIFVGLPVSSGFTYARIEHAAQRSDWMLVHQVHQFLRKWLIDHQQILSNEVYIGGDSYSGISIPVIVQEISQGNEKGVKPWINLQGYLLGNPSITRREDNYKIPFAHEMTLISDELYESLQKNCKGEYIYVDTRNVLCSRDMESFHEVCNLFYPIPSFLVKFSVTNPLIKAMKIIRETYVNFLCGFCANDDSVRSALHIRKYRKMVSMYLPYIPNKEDIPISFEYHVNLSRKGYRSLIYSGDHDLNVPFLGTEAWIRSLNYSIVDDWRPWLTNGQVAGYTRTYSNRMTFAAGGGHPAPEFKPEECFAMYSRWISNKAL